jgi:hypothetical protein
MSIGIVSGSVASPIEHTNQSGADEFLIFRLLQSASRVTWQHGDGGHPLKIIKSFVSQQSKSDSLSSMTGGE